MTESAGDTNIYMDNQGNYRDKTDENLEQYPPAAEPVPFTEEGEIDGAQLEADVTGDGSGQTLDPAETGDPESPVPPVEDNSLPDDAPAAKGKNK